MDREKQKKIKHVVEESRFFVGAVLVHVLLGLILVGTVLVKPILARKPFEATSYIGGEGPSAPPPPPPSAGATSDSQSPDVTTPTTSPTDIPLNELITVDSSIAANSVPNIVPPMPQVQAPSVGQGGTAKDPGDEKGMVGGIPGARAAMIRGFTGNWVKGGTGDGNPRALVAEFTCYVGRLSSGNDSLAFLRVNQTNGSIYGGSVPNLNEMINRFSKGKIRAKLEGSALRLDSSEIFEKKPPYIYITGRKDFRLTDAEVENLRKYLIMGGCIWGDAGLPGRRSPFDIAFRREMKRVVPDADKPFEPLPQDHWIYRNSYFPLNTGVPSGMNFAKEPIECIKIDGVEAIVYTLNGYGALWQVTFDDQLTKVDRSIMTHNERVTYAKRSTMYRNWGDEPLLNSYKLGINITAYLLTRYERKLRGI